MGAAEKSYYQRNREAILTKQRARRASPNGKKTRRAADLRDRYGMTHAEYVELTIAQDGLCAICHQEPGARGFHVDHDHATGKVRGLLCHGCNTALGLLQDNPHLLARAATYLKEA